MDRKNRLTKSKNIKRVRHLGISFAHPLIVLIKHPNNLNTTKFGIIVGKSIGNAVKRNRRRRQIREILRLSLPLIQPGWDIIILARKPSAITTYKELQAAITQLLERADLMITIDASKNIS